MITDSPLGKTSSYITNYSPDLLYPVPRAFAREKNSITAPFPFNGVDIWNGYELSWLNAKGKPEVAIATFYNPYDSKNIIESKSFKLYLNSFNQTKFDSFEDVKKTLEKDLSAVAEGEVNVDLYRLCDYKDHSLAHYEGIFLDDFDIETDTYEVDASFLSASDAIVQETLHSDLLKSNCLATGQPDWASVMVKYSGPQIDREGLLKYIISYRNHSGFHEDCVELMFSDIMRICQPEKLTVYARYTRRGGLDINPFRSNFEKEPSNARHLRQ